MIHDQANADKSAAHELPRDENTVQADDTDNAATGNQQQVPENPTDGSPGIDRHPKESVRSERPFYLKRFDVDGAHNQRALSIPRVIDNAYTTF
jgi:hypothetical protein